MNFKNVSIYFSFIFKISISSFYLLVLSSSEECIYSNTSGLIETVTRKCDYKFYSESNKTIVLWLRFDSKFWLDNSNKDDVKKKQVVEKVVKNYKNKFLKKKSYNIKNKKFVINKNTFNKDLSSVSFKFYESSYAKEPFHTILESEVQSYLTSKQPYYIRVDSPSNQIIMKTFIVSNMQLSSINLFYQLKGECTKDQLKCTSEDDCYFPSNRCDSIWHCAVYGSDETACHGCSNETYSCWTADEPSSSCYSYLQKCDGSMQCSTAADDADCDTTKCNPTYGTFLCSNSRCIKQTWLCDGTDDCGDMSDELECSVDNQSVKILVVLGSLSCLLLLLLIIIFSLKLYALHMKSSRERALVALEDEYIASILSNQDPSVENELLQQIQQRQQVDRWWQFLLGGSLRGRRRGSNASSSRSSSRDRRLLWSRCYGQHVSPLTHIQNEILDRFSAPPTYSVAMATSRSYNEFLAEQLKSGGYSEVVEERKEEEEEDDDEMLDVSEDANLLDNSVSKTNTSLVSWLNNDTGLLVDELLGDPPPSFEHVTAQVHPKRQGGCDGASNSHEMKKKLSGEKNKYNRKNNIKGLDGMVDVGCCSKNGGALAKSDEPPSFEEAMKKMEEEEDDDDILLV